MSEHPKPSTSDARRVAAGTAAALAAALALFAAGRAAGERFEITARGATGTEVPAGAVVLATLVGGAAALALARLARRTRRPRRTFLLAVAAGLAVSVLPPVQAADDVPTCLWLLALHAAAAAGIVPAVAAGLPRHAPAAGRATRGRAVGPGPLAAEGPA